MKVTNKILSIPPYVSTSWRNVQALHVSDGVLVVTLMDGDSIYIPNLSVEVHETIFTLHREFLEKDEEEIELAEPDRGQKPAQETAFLNMVFGPRSDSSALLRNIGIQIDNLGSMLQHNPDQEQAPNLPKEVLERIASMTKLITAEEPHLLPKAEPHCNCLYCQIARAMHKDEEAPAQADEPEVELEVSPEELTFRQWDIVETGDKLYQVTHRLNDQEKYNVFLGQPIGCTCGRPGCDHVIAVLQS